MSWWIYIREPRGKETHYCDECSHTHEADAFKEVFERNYTSNMSPMLRRAGFKWDDIEGKTGAIAYPIVFKLVDEMACEPIEYIKLNPPNGWGDYHSFMDLLRDFRDALLKYPDAIVHISR